MADMRGTQRQTPYYDTRTYRLRDSAGGLPAAGVPRTLSLIGTPYDRAPGDTQDDRIRRDRGPVLRTGYVVSGRDSGLVDWTAAGPIRAELGAVNATYRQMVGNSFSRALDRPWPRGGTQDQGHGLHTNPPRPQVSTAPMATHRYQTRTNPVMRSVRQDRLANSRFAGQSYSQTTRPQGT
jgi:hypothetical protein